MSNEQDKKAFIIIFIQYLQDIDIKTFSITHNKHGKIHKLCIVNVTVLLQHRQCNLSFLEIAAILIKLSLISHYKQQKNQNLKFITAEIIGTKKVY